VRQKLLRASLPLLLISVAVFGLGPSPEVHAGSDQGRAGGRAPRKRVLAWADTRNGQAQHESVGHALAIIERLGYESGLWDTFIRTDSNIISKTPKKTDGTAASGGPNLGQNPTVGQLDRVRVDSTARALTTNRARWFQDGNSRR